MTGVDDLRIGTPRLTLRPLTVADVPLVLTWAADPDVVRNFSFFANGADPERIRAYIDEKTESPADLLLAVLRNDDGAYCGNVGLHELDNGSAERNVGRRQPNRLQVAPDQFFVGHGMAEIAGGHRHGVRGPRPKRPPDRS